MALDEEAQERFDYFVNQLCLGNLAPCEILADFSNFLCWTLQSDIAKIVHVRQAHALKTGWYGSYRYLTSNEYSLIFEFKKCLRPKNVDSLNIALQVYGHTHKSCSSCYPFLVLFLEHFYDDVGLPPWAQRICLGP